MYKFAHASQYSLKDWKQEVESLLFKSPFSTEGLSKCVCIFKEPQLTLRGSCSILDAKGMNHAIEIP